ncbi:hypothetical protein [Sphingomonas immobilis]|uniref:Uncharacterized protein n=1 Tax=Sphingomonas immobilis TaxID=3063997 RepID=A0ABT9A3A3_9SPHN|nr:hypothetical protein [Sphingomonas sp. CA1-15]MDO7844321.1 hypothetical protein [Sphingomonas sp. CA1-15]
MSDDNPPPPDAAPIFHRDRMEYWAFVAQIISAVAVVISLVFVGLQLHDSNIVAVRSEANDLQSEWSSLRRSIYGNRDTAAMFQTGMDESKPLDPADALRFRYLMREHGWATYQLWERMRDGLQPPDRFFANAGPEFMAVVCTPGGVKAWAAIRREYPAPYVADLDRLAGQYARAHHVRCVP